MKNDAMIKVWLKRAKSNLQIARAGKVDVSFPRTHSIAHLIELIEEHSIEVPDGIKDSIENREITSG